MEVLVVLRSAASHCTEASTPALGDEQGVVECVGQLGCQNAEFTDRQLWACDQLMCTAEEPVREAELDNFNPVGDPGDGAVAVRDEETRLAARAGPGKESYVIHVIVRHAAPSWLRMPWGLLAA